MGIGEPVCHPGTRNETSSMFERNKIDNVEQQSVAIQLTIDGGETLSGRAMIGIGRTLANVLNSPEMFIEFEPWSGERVMISKASIRSVKPLQVARPDSLKGRIAAMDDFDPYTILGVKAEASLEEVKSAWHRLSKTYHPDRYASAELPTEVLDYLAAMARRVNAAYAALEGPLHASRKAAAMRTAPMYTSVPRG
jgi:hypothetical protein